MRPQFICWKLRSIRDSSKISRAGLSRTNASRNLHVLIAKSARLFPVAIDVVSITIRIKKPRHQARDVFWPVVKMSSWIHTLLGKHPALLLAGHSLQEVDGWKMTFSSFWGVYRTVDPTHPFFSSNLPWGSSIPIYFHGDEGQGLRGKPLMIQSWQPVIGASGMFATNDTEFLVCILWCVLE